MTSAELDLLLLGEPFSGLDAEFAGLMARLSGDHRPELRLAAALVSRRRSEGEVCLDLARAAGSPVENEAGASCRAPALADWLSVLGESPVVVGGPGAPTPLILDGTRLYWRRYWDYEQRLAAMLSARAEASSIPVPDPVRAGEVLDRLFPPSAAGGVDWQRVAAYLVIRNRLTVILGGPGTGKTRTVSRALALLLDQHGPSLRVAVAAPTGKAAARLQSAIRAAKSELAAVVPSIQALDDEVRTIHRLLRMNPRTGQPRFNAANPLAADVLVVDEASMVDLALMTKLVAALPESSRLVLLGDRDQLAAVEAGSVLGDLAPEGRSNRFSAERVHGIRAVAGVSLTPAEERVPALADCVVELRTNHRFGAGSRIQRASECVNAGDAAAAMEVLSPGASSGDGDATWRPLPSRNELPRALGAAVVARFAAVCRAADPAAALREMERFRVLAAVRAGPYGVEGLNQWITDLLRESGAAGPGSWFAGRQVLVTANDPDAGLFNGDLGVVMPDAEGRTAVWFADPDGAPRRVAPSRLPPHETAFALTVHKSQGSEFEEVLLILPERSSPVLTRELVYTGLTRARRRTEIWSREAVFREAVSRRIQRASGLRERLWG